MDLGLEGKIALVTGASRGIGKSVSMLLAREGAKVAINARGIADLEKTVSEVTAETGAEVIAAAADVSDLPALPGLVDTVMARWGRIDILVNNAGVGLYKAFLDVTLEELLRTYHLNIFSAYRLCQLVIPPMVAQGGGVILQVGGSTAKQPHNDPLYGTASSSSKAALFNFSKALATEFGPRGVRVNCVLPGFTMTPRFREYLTASSNGDAERYRQEMQRWGGDIVLPDRRWAEPEEIAAVIVFLCSERASYVNSAGVIVDGGMIRAL